MRHICTTFLLLALATCAAQAAGIEGAAERYRFEPGDRPIYEAPLDQCPVGELLPGWKVARGGYECARFRDRMWIRPLEHGTLLYLPLPRPLPEEFSLELTVHSFEPGQPLLRFGLHTEEVLEALGRGVPEASWMLIGGLVAVGTATDLLLFPLSGLIMDRYGRLHAMLPAYGLLGVGLALLAVAEGPTMAVVAGAVMGVGNGLSSGSLFTLGSDLAPPESRGPFLGAMAVMTDAVSPASVCNVSSRSLMASAWGSLFSCGNTSQSG
jgi:hypothetical protein